MSEATVVIPTRAREAYLEVALRSIAASTRDCDADVLVVDDAGETARTRALAERFGASYRAHARPLGLNAARNTGVGESRGELMVFVDDDVEVDAGWLRALLGAARANPDVDVFTGPVRARLEGPAPRSCGREAPPITTLDLGVQDTDASFAWGANMAIRRSALERVGEFDETLAGGGDEQEWQERMRAIAPAARVRYVAEAALVHRREGADARLRALCRTAFVRGRAARRFDARRGSAPSRRAEAATLARCLAHVLRRRCPAGLTMAAHSLGRLTQDALEGWPARASATAAPAAGAPGEPRDDFLSGTSGTVGGLDGVRRAAADRAVDAWARARGTQRRLALAAEREPPRRAVLALGVVRPQYGGLAARVRAELERSRHRVELHTCAPQGRGRFENLNRLLGEHPPEAFDWLLIVDDDVQLPHGFLDRFLFVCERFEFALAQPAHRLDSHAAWSVTRRRAGSVARETGFVEIGPVTAFARATFSALLPFPELRMGWGLDVHWAAIARERGWRCGVVDAVAIRHRAAPAASAYPREAAVAEARAFLAEHAYVSAQEAERTLATHRRW
jgi:GT2 family glycosyltransferase